MNIPGRISKKYVFCSDNERVIIIIILVELNYTPTAMKDFLLILPSKMARWYWISLLVVLEILFLWGFNGMFSFSIIKMKEITGGLGLPDENLYYSYNQLFQMFERYGADGRAMYLNLQWVDMIYPLVYSLLLGSLLAILCKRSRFAWMILLPFVASLFDWTENILLRISVHSFPAMDNTVVQIASIATLMKWILLLLTLLALGIGLIARITLWLRQRSKVAAGVSTESLSS